MIVNVIDIIEVKELIDNILLVPLHTSYSSGSSLSC